MGGGAAAVHAAAPAASGLALWLAHNHLPGLADQIGLWVAAFLTLAIYSFLYGDNPVYKFAEHLFVGISAGYGVIILYYAAVLHDMIYPLFRPAKVNMEAPNYWIIIPIILGLMILTLFSRRWAWMYRYPIGFIMGFGAGVSIPSAIQAIIIKQLSATVRPVVDMTVGHGFEAKAWTSFSNILLVGGLLCTLSYFYFSLERRGALKATSKMGMWFLMVAFGAAFGNTVMARMTLLIGRVEFLRFKWWPAADGLVRALWHVVTGHPAG